MEQAQKELPVGQVSYIAEESAAAGIVGNPAIAPFGSIRILSTRISECGPDDIVGGWWARSTRPG
jgi:hypothetical protein